MGHFDHLNVAFFTKAAIYPGSIGTFRYRFQREGWTDGKGVLTVWVYENTSFELAKDVAMPDLSLDRGRRGADKGLAGAEAGGTGQPALFHPLSRSQSGVRCTGTI